MIIDTEKVYRLADIARVAGMSPSAVSNWRVRHKDFPEPVAVIPTWGAAGYDLALFDRDEIDAWLDAHLGGRAERLAEREANLKSQLAAVRRDREKLTSKESR